MQSRFADRIHATQFLEEDSQKYIFYFSILRAMLQYYSIFALELSWKLADEIEKEKIHNQAIKLLQVSDGSLVQIIDECIIILRRTLKVSVFSLWFREGEDGLSVKDLLNKIVEERNDRIGHGVVDTSTVTNGLALFPGWLLRILSALCDIENCGEKQTIVSGNQYFTSELTNKPLLVIRKIDRKGSNWRIKYQELDPLLSEEHSILIAQCCTFSEILNHSLSGLRSTVLHINSYQWNPSFILPIKQTDKFFGRKNEIAELDEWWNDSDSFTCLVYGEGGIGKTTLVLEYLNNILNGENNQIGWFPDIIFFFSAKQTRWGVDGIEYLTGTLPSVAEGIRQLVSILIPAYTKDWAIEDIRSIIDKASTLFSELNVKRNQILLVFDNTETLARDPKEEAQIGQYLRQISTKIGRLILTSRRREQVEAKSILVEAFDEETSVDLLKNLAKDNNALPLLQAGESTLRKCNRQLSGKPILLDALVKYIARSNASIEKSVANILSQERSDLGEFLFEDAWLRISNESKQVFYIIGQLGGVVSGQIIAWACGDFRISIDDWMSSFDETRFGSMRDYGTHYDIILEPSTREFITQKYLNITFSEKSKIDTEANMLRQRYQDLLKADKTLVTDRIAEAFRTTAAKAAKLAAERGNEEEAILWYEEAVASDSTNAALLDRFAWYLMVKHNLERAKIVSENACKLNEKDADSHFTAGMIRARLGLIDDSDKHLDIAQSLGRKKYQCDLQKARARIEWYGNNQFKLDASKQKRLFSEIDSYLESAQDSNGEKDFYFSKHLEEIRRTRNILNRIRKNGKC